MSTVRLLPTDRNVIIAIGSIAGAVILFIFFYNVWKCCRLPKLPPPPKGLLAFERRRPPHEQTDTPANFTRFPAKPIKPLLALVKLQDVHQHHNPSHSFLTADISNIATTTDLDEPKPPASPMGQKDGQSPSSLDLITPNSSVSPDLNPPIFKKTIARMTSTRSIATRSVQSRPESLRSYATHGPPMPTFRGLPHRQRMDIVLPRPLAPLP